MTTYPSLNAFYDADVRRRSSRERDLGLGWRAGDGATFRAAWIEETGEVYVFKHGAGTVELVAGTFERRDLQARLGNYHYVCGAPDSLAWFLDRTRAPAAA
jgi:hypothetical protein